MVLRIAAFLSASESSLQRHGCQRESGFEEKDKENKPSSDNTKNLTHRGIFSKKYFLDPIDSAQNISLE
jgi:hypothetical protein